VGKDQDFTALTLTEVAERIRNRDVSPVELIDATFARIKSADTKLNAFIHVSEEEARAAADDAERAIALGDYRGQLHGVPIGLKDLVAVRGEVCSAGSKVLSDFVPDEDATVAARLRSAGAVLVGRLNMDEFAFGVTTDNPHYGATRNPWDTERMCGGSSGGSAAAVAARLCYGAIGTDTACSVRLPAAFGGISGLRPTFGRVSNYGIVPLARSLDTVGPMCRTAGDCALMLGALAGNDPRDPDSLDIPVPDYAEDIERDLGGLRITIIDDYTLRGLQAGVRDVIKGALCEFELAGLEIHRVPVEYLEPSVGAVRLITAAEAAAYHAAWMQECPGDYGEDVLKRLEAGTQVSAAECIDAQRYRVQLREQLIEILGNANAILTPTVPITAPPLGAETVSLDSAENVGLIPAVLRFNALASLTGLPALSIPCGFSVDDLPVGLQLIGSPFDEATLLRLGRVYQERTAWHKREPKV
jgi:aspartyl-tRNA(Asn)/glutamyl-tRNA(Gln) amidotransferase subunit A